jgi:hypothetical protein
VAYYIRSSICQSSSWEPLDITEKMLSEILTYHQVPQEFTEVIRSHTTRDHPSEEAYCGHWFSKTSANREGKLKQIPPMPDFILKRASVKMSATVSSTPSSEADRQVSHGQFARHRYTIVSPSIRNRCGPVGSSCIQCTNPRPRSNSKEVSPSKKKQRNLYLSRWYPMSSSSQHISQLGETTSYTMKKSS